MTKAFAMHKPLSGRAIRSMHYVECKMRLAGLVAHANTAASAAEAGFRLDEVQALLHLLHAPLRCWRNQRQQASPQGPNIMGEVFYSIYFRLPGQHPTGAQVSPRVCFHRPSRCEWQSHPNHRPAQALRPDAPRVLELRRVWKRACPFHRGIASR